MVQGNGDEQKSHRGPRRVVARGLGAVSRVPAEGRCGAITSPWIDRLPQHGREREALTAAYSVAGLDGSARLSQIAPDGCSLCPVATRKRCRKSLTSASKTLALSQRWSAGRPLPRVAGRWAASARGACPHEPAQAVKDFAQGGIPAAGPLPSSRSDTERQRPLHHH